MAPQTDVDVEANLFEERAENLSDDEFDAWTQPAPHERQILRQLTSRGPRLLSGPRGSGKTTLLLTASRHIQRQLGALPVYSNYGQSMFIEPAFNARTDADGFFQDWLSAKLIAAARDAVKRVSGREPSFLELAQKSAAFIASAEVDPLFERAFLPGASSLAKLLEGWAHEAGRARVVLLLDDAAHAFVPEQQRIFFEFLRNTRSPNVTFKAAIYPGVTEFSPNFHVGHDAQIVHAWLSISESEYVPFMRAAFTRRIPSDIRRRVSKEVIDLFAGASFGIPRTFFAMIESYLESRTERSRGGAAGRIPMTVISAQSETLRAHHRVLATKIPRYKNYVEVGERVLDRTLSQIRQLNEQRMRQNREETAMEIAIRQPVDSKLRTVFGLLEYTGLIRRTNESISLGREGTYSKFAVHGCLLLASNALSYGKNPTMQIRADSLFRASRTGSYKRVGSDVLLPPDDAKVCKLSVGDCSQCGVPRASEEARFCSNCGHELTSVSRLSELLSASVQALALTDRKLQALREVGLSNVESLVRDRGLVEITKANRVGPVWARRIHSLAMEFVGV